MDARFPTHRELDMARRLLAAALLAAALAACTGSQDIGTTTDAGAQGAGDAGTPDGAVPDAGAPDAGAPDAGLPDAGLTWQPPVQPPGAAGPSNATARGGGLDIGANAGTGGALFFNDTPAAGQPVISGLVLVALVGTQGAAPPPDTVVTLNGVALVHAVLGGAVSPRHFTVDPAGPQPTIGADGFLHLVASSATGGLSRELNLACPPAIAVTLAPPPTSGLAGVSSVRLDWPAGSLPVQGRDFSAFGLNPPQASLEGLDPATGALSFIANPTLLAPDAVGATLAVAATAAPAYAVELRYPGVFFLDGETGGACGRTQRFPFSK
jgi:hypothetical protein